MKKLFTNSQVAGIKADLHKIVRKRKKYYVSAWGLALIGLVLLSQPQKKEKRKPSKWSLFAGDYMKKGKTIKDAAIAWKKLKNKK